MPPPRLVKTRIDSKERLSDFPIEPLDFHSIYFFRFFVLGPVTTVHHRVFFQVRNKIFHSISGGWRKNHIMFGANIQTRGFDS